MTDITNYPNCKIVISEIGRKKIHLTITPDPVNPTSTIIVESTVGSANHFKDYNGAPRQPASTYEGTLQSRQFVFTMDKVWNSGPEYEFKFEGLRE